MHEPCDFRVAASVPQHLRLPTLARSPPASCRLPTHSAHMMKLMIFLLISLLLATSVEASKKKCTKCTKKFEAAERKFIQCKKKSCPSPSPPLAPPSYKFASKDYLQQAILVSDANPALAEVRYGPIAGWDVSGITDMSWLFREFEDFNADISNWNTSRVTDISFMFDVRSSAARALSP